MPELLAPAALPDDFDTLSVAEQKQAVELAMSAITGQYNDLVTDLDKRTKWEAVRLSAALNQKSHEHAEQMTTAVSEAMASQGRKFDAALNHRTQQLKQQHMLEVASRVADQKNKNKQELSQQLELAHVQAQAKLSEELLSQEAEIYKQVGEGAAIRTDELQRLQMKVQALQQVLVDDAEYKMRSHQAHKVSQSVLAINKCLQLNAPFKDELAALAQVGEVEPLIAVVAASVPAAAAAKGTCTRSQLQESLKEIGPEACRAALMPEDGNLLWYGFTWAINKAKIKERGQVEGDSALAVITRAEDYLERGNLKAALDEVGSLQGMPAQVMSDWKNRALERLQIEQALELARAHTLCMTTTFE